MLYHLFDYLERHFDFFGAGLFRYISFRAGMVVVFSLAISAIYGNRFIAVLRRLQVGEAIRDLGLEGQLQKTGTPTMGGVIIISAILIPTLLFARLDNVYVQLLLVSTVWLGIIGFVDDYIKVFKKDKQGLKGVFKVIGQVGLGLIVGLTLYFHDEVVIRAFTEQVNYNSIEEAPYQDIKSMITNVPFFKKNQFSYHQLIPFLPDGYTWVVYVAVVTFIITAVSNGANLTDGIDGLAAGSSAIIGLTLGLFAYVSGNAIFSNYLNILYIPGSAEVVIFCAAFVGACIGFLWYNAYPAQVFMGDTGSLTLGGLIAVFALTIRKELMIPLLCGVFLVELLSVIIQVYYFRYTKKKYGEGRRVFRMSPLHHHYQKANYHEAKIVTRFWVVGILLAVLSLATLKLR